MNLQEIEHRAAQYTNRLVEANGAKEANFYRIKLEGLAYAVHVKTVAAHALPPVPPPACGYPDQTGRLRCIKSPLHEGLHTDGAGVLWSTQPVTELPAGLGAVVETQDGRYWVLCEPDDSEPWRSVEGAIWRRSIGRCATETRRQARTQRRRGPRSPLGSAVINLVAAIGFVAVFYGVARAWEWARDRWYR